MNVSAGRSLAPQQPFRLDLHNHTAFSSDGVMSPAKLLRTARRHGLGCVAVTDHNSVEGALQALALAEADPTLPCVIPGIEISAAEGDVIGLYVTEAIPRGLPALETIARIHAQGGVVYLPHPFDVVRRGAIAARVREEVAEAADMIEVLNGKSLSPWSVRNSDRLARRHGKPRAAGSDAHGSTEVGRAYVMVERLPTREDLVELVAAGAPRSGLHWHEYLLNWALQPLAVFTRFRRKSGQRLLRGR
jgi:predicted metal-dependent phosphoesterase TrpH